MTYPPQQPGQGGWGQQPPGGFPPPGPQQPPPWGNQPPQPNGWNPQGPPQQSPMGQPQMGQPQMAEPQWGGELSPGNWMHEPDGFDDDIEPENKKSKAPLIFGIIGAVVVLAAICVGAFFLLGNGGPGEARPAAQKFVERINVGDFDTINGMLCTPNKAKLTSDFNSIRQAKLNLQLGQVSEQGDRATAQVAGNAEQGGTSVPLQRTLTFVVEDDQWKLCDLGQ